MLIADVSNLFKQGKALTSPATWANNTALTGVLSGFLLAAVHVAKLFGYDFGVQDDTLNKAAAGIAALVLIGTNVLHVLANKDAGVSPDSSARPVADSAASRGQGGG